MPGIRLQSVFVYRTIRDLEQNITYAGQSRRAAVIGDVLLGLEAAKATYDLGLETHVINFAPRLTARQIEDDGSRALVCEIKQLGVIVHFNEGAKQILSEQREGY